MNRSKRHPMPACFRILPLVLFLILTQGVMAQPGKDQTEVIISKKLSTEVTTVDVWLLSGQSNMQGVGKVSDLPEDIPREIPNAWYWNQKEFEPLVLGKTKTSSRAGEFGPEVGFALGMATPEHPVFLIKYHASGMPLHHGWHANQWQGAEPAPGRRNFYPGESAEDPNQGTLYQAMLKQYVAGIEHLKTQHKSPVIRGFLWMQGEQDSKHELSATTYAMSLKRLRDRLSSDLQVKKLPMVFGQVLPHEPALERFTHRTEVRASMAAADADSGSPDAIPLVKMVSTDGFELLSDTVHYNASGQLKLGRAMAESLRSLVDLTSH